jgi:hypothetical protein
VEKSAEQILPGSEEGGDKGGEMAQTMYTHINKCLNNFFKSSTEKFKFHC